VNKGFIIVVAYTMNSESIARGKDKRSTITPGGGEQKKRARRTRLQGEVVNKRKWVEGMKVWVKPKDCSDFLVGRVEKFFDVGATIEGKDYDYAIRVSVEDANGEFVVIPTWHNNPVEIPGMHISKHVLELDELQSSLEEPHVTYYRALSHNANAAKKAEVQQSQKEAQPADNQDRKTTFDDVLMGEAEGKKQQPLSLHHQISALMHSGKVSTV
jgi:hypothetical protein